MIKESGFLASLVIHGKNRATVTYITSSIRPQSRQVSIVSAQRLWIQGEGT